MVVTIVVLLILAGVSISLILDNDGIIQKSKDARKQYGEAQTNEQADLENISSWIEEQVNGETSKLLPDATEATKPYLPTGFIKEEGTNLINGLVIKDSAGNEYVWIEVPRTINVYTIAGLNITEFLDAELELIEKDLMNYITEYRTEGCLDDWYSGCGIEDPSIYKEKYNKMLKSVYKNGGFWIGRYEIGIDENTARYDNSNVTDKYTHNHSIKGQTPVIKPNKIPYNWIQGSQAEIMAETFAPSGFTTSLMFGIQWDLMLAHIQNKGGVDTTTLTNDSTDIGNYKNNKLNITNDKAKYSSNYGTEWNNCPYQKETEEAILLTTGASETFAKMNIYDLAGNLWELTLEKNSDGNNTICGGSYTGNGAEDNAIAIHGTTGNISTNTSNIGARVALY